MLCNLYYIRNWCIGIRYCYYKPDISYRQKKMILQYWHSALCQYQISAMRNTWKLDCNVLEKISYIFVASDIGKILFWEIWLWHISDIRFWSNSKFLWPKGLDARSAQDARPADRRACSMQGGGGGRRRRGDGVQ